MGRVTLTIHIDYPDGAGITVGHPQTAAPPPAGLEDPPWPTSPAEPSAAGGVCPVHHVPWKTVPAGVSKKTGAAYNAFQACPQQGCNERPKG